MRKTSLCIIVKENKILLAMKKRGFGIGKWNGPGGKFNTKEGDKNIWDTAIRETEEEIGIKPKDIKEVGVLNFTFPHNSEWDQNVHIFLVKDWDGEPIESEEMLPKWFNIDEIPFNKMWEDDKYWLPEVLNGKKIKKGNFIFAKGNKIKDYEIEFS